MKIVSDWVLRTGPYQGVYGKPMTSTPNKRKRAPLSDEDKRKMLAYNVKRRFGLEWEEYLGIYATRFAEQGGVCAICGTEPKDKTRRMPLDHCHETGKIRGLLCVRCNRGLGGFSDRLDLVEAAVDYLKEYL